MLRNREIALLTLYSLAATALAAAAGFLAPGAAGWAALAGRDILCGSPSYLYYHGLDYTRQQEAARQVYEAPGASRSLFDAWGVDYVLVSGFGRGPGPGFCRPWGLGGPEGPAGRPGREPAGRPHNRGPGRKTGCGGGGTGG